MFIQKLKELIAQKGITKNKLLTDLGLGKNSFINWETRGTVPSGETLSRIADYFDVSVDYLLGNTDEKKKPTALGGEPLQTEDPLLKEALAMLDQLSPEKREQAYRFLRFLSEDSQHNQ